MSHVLVSSPIRAVAWLVLAALVCGLPHALVRCTPNVGVPHVELRGGADCHEHTAVTRTSHHGDRPLQEDGSHGCRHDRIGPELAPAPSANKTRIEQPLTLDGVELRIALVPQERTHRAFCYGTGPPRQSRAIDDRRTTELRE